MALSALAPTALDDDEADDYRLHEVWLHDFKSYAGAVRVGPFHPRLNVVVGPNGCGKSCLVSGIGFALGLRADHRRQPPPADGRGGVHARRRVRAAGGVGERVAAVRVSRCEGDTVASKNGRLRRRYADTPGRGAISRPARLGGVVIAGSTLRSQRPPARSPMGDCLSTCLGGREETEEDRLMSREARARAAEAAAARQQSFQQSSQGRAAARQHERDQAERKAGPSRGNDNARDWLS